MYFECYTNSRIMTAQRNRPTELHAAWVDGLGFMELESFGVKALPRRVWQQFRDHASTICSFYLRKLKTTHTEYYERQTSSAVPLKVSAGSCPHQLTVCKRGSINRGSIKAGYI